MEFTVHLQYANLCQMNASKLRVYARLQRAAHLLSKAADRELLSVAGITTAQAAVLAVISENDERTRPQRVSRCGNGRSFGEPGAVKPDPLGR